MDFIVTTSKAQELVDITYEVAKLVKDVKNAIFIFILSNP